MKIKTDRFIIFRYQILPVTRHFQGLLFENIKSLEDLISKKNDILSRYLKEFDRIIRDNSQLIIKSQGEREDALLFKFAVNRSMTRETDKFTEEELVNWPSFLVFFWNNPDKQYLIIQYRRKAFQRIETIVEAIERYLSDKLKQSQLTIHIEPLFNMEDFWEIIEKHSKNIREINFELITPNMANISATLSEDLKNLAYSTDTIKTQLLITSDDASSLKISKNNDLINNLVEYSSNGGGNISIKVNGVRCRIQTAKSKKTFEINEAQITGSNPNQIIEFLKEHLL